MITAAIIWKYPSLEVTCIEDVATGKIVLADFPHDVDGINYTNQDVPIVTQHGHLPKYESKYLPSKENQDSWIEEYEANGLPSDQWKEKMVKSDLTMMTREREGFITKIDNGVADNKEEQDRYNAKIALRHDKP